VLVVLAVSVAVVCARSVPVSTLSDMGEGDWLRVPGGSVIHRTCIHEVENGALIDEHTLPPCQFRNPPPEMLAQPNAQIYSIDTHWTTTDVIMQSFNASFNCPGMPPRAAGQINYFWPGFKSTQPTMGLPVIQPVFQYGTGNNWVVRSWYVYGDIGEAVASPPVAVRPGDILGSYMDFDKASQTWTIYSVNTRTSQPTTLKVTKAKTHNTDFKVAMLVLETIMPPNDCKQLPASPSSITFTGVSVNGQIPPWTPRTQMHDCNQKVSSIDKDKVTFTWTN